MSERRVVQVAYPDAASNTSLTSAFAVPKEYSHFAIVLPGLFANTATCGVGILTSDSPTGTFRKIAYSNNPATVTSTQVFWDTPASAAISGAVIVCEALMFAQEYAKLQFTNTVTANTAFKIIGTNFK